MKKSINIGFFGNDVPLDTVFSKLAALGFKGAELNMTDTQHTYPNLYNGVSDEETAAVGELLKKHSLECVGIVTDQLWTYHLTSDDAKIRNEAIDRIKKMIHIANVLGASSVLVVPGIINENVTYKNAYANAIESLKILAPIAEKAGVKLGIEDV
ncbi:MAG: sugar phosphate isomerase/epimerase family protein, partial [Clostridia bacterium]